MNVRSCMTRPCPVILNSTCVYYAGENLIYTGINTNDNLETALQKIDAAIGSAGTQITLTTTGSSGPATLTGNVLNIPDYSTATPVVPSWQQTVDINNHINSTPLYIGNGSSLHIEDGGSLELDGYGGAINMGSAYEPRVSFTTPNAVGYIIFGAASSYSGNGYYLNFPDTSSVFTSYYLPLSVNGQFADASGNITIGAPNLQDVLNVGNTATTNIELNNARFIVKDTINNIESLLLTNGGTGQLAFIDNNTGNTISLVYQPDGTSGYSITFPAKNGGFYFPLSVNGNVADASGNITVSGGSQNLQQVTDVGNTTTKPIIISNLGASTSIYPDYHEIAFSNYATDYGYNYIAFGSTSGGINIQFPLDETLVSTYTLNFPLNLPSSSYTIPVSVNGNYADSNGNINASSVFTGSI